MHKHTKNISHHILTMLSPYLVKLGTPEMTDVWQMLRLNCFCDNFVNTHTQPFNGLLSGTTRVGRYQKKHSPTLTHPDDQTSFIIFLHLQRSMVYSVQFTNLTVLSDNLSPGPLWSSSWTSTLNFILHAFLHPIIIIFSQHMTIPTQPVLLLLIYINCNDQLQRYK